MHGVPNGISLAAAIPRGQIDHIRHGGAERLAFERIAGGLGDGEWSCG
jgi:hypothetical protein